MQKKTLNLAVPAELLADFNRVCALYGHGKQKGMVLSAAVLMFLEAPASDQVNFVRRAAMAEVDAAASRLGIVGQAGMPSSQADVSPASPQRKAAKHARPSVHGLDRLASSPQTNRNLPLPSPDSDDL
ncbi:MAG: hypothetical protein IT441_09710 [Phycisphaeraceae bacterium]|nr:hypothetical protein [Phycisphaeraceae bacterium]